MEFPGNSVCWLSSSVGLDEVFSGDGELETLSGFFSWVDPVSFAALTAKATPAPIAISASTTNSHSLPRPPPPLCPPS